MKNKCSVKSTLCKNTKGAVAQVKQSLMWRNYELHFNESVTYASIYAKHYRFAWRNKTN